MDMRMNFQRIIIGSALVMAGIILVLPPALARAATISIVPAGRDTFAIKLDTGGASVNTVALTLSFDPAAFSVSAVNDGGSVIDLWIVPPSFSNASGTIDLAGIVPGGIVTASGTIATVAFVPANGGGAAISGPALATGTVLLNDGKGTPAPLSYASGMLTPAPSSSVPGIRAVDTAPPDPFVPEIASDPNIFGGRYFLVFSATDRNSGIGHYEVLEVPTDPAMDVSSEWVSARSPYLLQDQTLSSNIYVRAVDNAGNFRVVEVPAEHPYRASYGWDVPWEGWDILIGFLFLILFAAIIWTRKRSR